MHGKPTSPTTRARWVVPAKKQYKPRQQQATPKLSSKNNNNATKNQYHYNDFDEPCPRKLHNPLYHNDSGFIDEPMSQSNKIVPQIHLGQADSYTDAQLAVVDECFCKTICLFVEQNLKDLEEHQKLIDQARTSLSGCSRVDYIIQTDVNRLHIRDRQTKAIETLRRLTNYLRELSNIIRQHEEYRASKNAIKLADHVEEIFNKLSDVRNDILRSVNFFIWTNRDIEVPISDSDELVRLGYDLCVDQDTANSPQQLKLDDNNHLQLPDKTAINTESILTYRSGSFLINDSAVIISDDEDSHDHTDHNQKENSAPDQVSLDQCVAQTSSDALEKRQKDVHKLMRDSQELVKLFSEFHNLVTIQGEKLDTIEENITTVSGNVKVVAHDIRKVSLRRSRMLLIVPVAGGMVGAAIGGPIGIAVGSKIVGMTVLCATSILGFITSYGIQRCVTHEVVSR